MANKSTLYKIPTEEEIQKTKPDVQPEPEIAPEPPVVEPEPVAVLDTAEKKELPKPKQRKDAISEEDAKVLAEKEAARKLHDKRRRDPDFDKEEEVIPVEVMKHENAREFLKTIDLTEFEGISVSGRNILEVKAARRVTRDRRRENVEKRKTMKVMIAGEEQELSEASKYMLDMLIKNPTKD